MSIVPERRILKTIWRGDRRAPLLPIVALMAVLGCEAPVPEADEVPSEMTTVPGEATFGTPPETIALEVPSSVTGLGVWDGDLVLGSDEGLYRVFGESIQLVELVSLPEEPDSTGPIQAISSREDGVLVAAENGIFHDQDHVLVLSPLSDALEGIAVRDMTVTGDGQVAWVATDDGLLWIADESLSSVDLPMLAEAPHVVAANETVVVVGAGTSTVEIDPSTWVVRSGPTAFGEIHDIAAGPSVIAIASDGGLIIRDDGGNYTTYTLSDDETPVSVKAVHVDAADGVTALGASGFVRVVEGELEGLALPTAVPAGVIAVDGSGHVWTATDSDLTGVLVGFVPGFAIDIAPLLSAQCNSCHLNGLAPMHDFTDLGEVEALIEPIVERVSTGQMPPNTPLAEEELGLVLSWATSGMNP